MPAAVVKHGTVTPKFRQGKISPLFLTAKFSPRNSPLTKFSPPLYRYRGGGGDGTQNFVYQKWPNKIFPLVNFVFSHDGHFGLEARGTPHPRTAILILPCLRVRVDAREDLTASITASRPHLKYLLHCLDSLPQRNASPHIKALPQSPKAKAHISSRYQALLLLLILLR